MKFMYRELLLTCFVLILSLLTLVGEAQVSLLEQIERLQPAIVSIKSLNTEIFQKPGMHAALDRKTGRVVVLRRLHGGSYNRFGAGVIVHESGIIVTNAHNIINADRITVILNDHTELLAKVLLVTKDMDFGFIQVDLPYPITPVALANADEIKLGDEIITVGNSPLLKQTISGGKIIGLGNSRTQKRQGQKRTDLIQTTVNLYESDSGGPLFDRKGHLLGLMTAKETAVDHSSFAIPANQIHRFLQEYLHGLRHE